jgi:C1A family cysteine protease
MKTFIAAAIASSAFALDQFDYGYMKYVTEHNKSYATLEEYQMRMAYYLETEAFIQEHNESNANFTLGHNQFSDMSERERKERLGAIPMPAENVEETVFSTENLPTSVDWRSAGAVNAVKDQGQCGSCWAFSAIGTLEGAHFLATGSLKSFSEQELVDCATSKYSNYGCNGGMYDRAWDYLSNHYSMLESTYRYTAKDGTCQYGQLPETSVETLKTIYPKKFNTDQLKAAVATAPISIGIEADRRVFQQYSSGIFDSTQCGTQLDHAVMLVGYGSENGQDYFILRNSWGTTWGEKGYMRVAYTAGSTGYGICGINQYPAYTTAN